MASAGAAWHRKKSGARFVQKAGESRQKAARRSR